MNIVKRLLPFSRLAISARQVSSIRLHPEILRPQFPLHYFTTTEENNQDKKGKCKKDQEKVEPTEEEKKDEAQNITKKDLIDTMKKKIDELVKAKDIILFMKGTAKEPGCGFSQYVVNLMAFYKIEKFQIVDVTANPIISEGVKEYADWPTIPLLFIKGKFIGGYDVLRQMHMDGSLEELLIKEEIIPNNP